jgi:cation-transporting ATPase 13A1
MRMILFSSERVTVENREVYWYLLILLFFALMASYKVLMKGLEDPDRSRYKILLRCVLIITNVVPPELPMELSLTVNYSILSLIKKQIFCTEPFRIPNAGKVNICCFDKTGTLTKNELVIKGVTAMNLTKVQNWATHRSDSKSQKQVQVQQTIVPLEQVWQHSKDALFVLAGCHTIAVADGTLVGDPIEKQAFEGINFVHDGRRTSQTKTGEWPRVVQVKRFLFESSLKRQSAIVEVQQKVSQNRQVSHRVLCKGAPEVVEKLLKEVPDGYTENYINHTKNGARVLVLAYKDIKSRQELELLKITRDEAESDLTFCGFLISECPLKEDTQAVVEELVSSQHEVKMITGDNQLTAAYVAHQLNFAPNSGGKSLFA